MWGEADMGRWSPTVLPEAPRFARPIDIGSALGELAGGISDRRARNDRLAREQDDRDRYYDAENNRRIERALDRQRQATLDARNEEDRKLRRERDFVDLSARAEDDGYVTDAARGERQRMGRDLKAGGGVMGVGVGDALLAASTGDDTMTLTRPDGSAETRYRDPTRTKEARDENTWRAREEYRDRMKPPARDPVADEVREYEEKLKIDQKYRVNDFAPREPRGGGGGGGRGGGTSPNDPRIGMADKMIDNAGNIVRSVQSAEPTAPNFDKFRGQSRPLDETDPMYPAFKADSIAKATAYDTERTQWEGRLNKAVKAQEQWFSIGDALARDVVGARGGESIATQQQVNAQREITAVQRRVNEKLADVQGDPVAMDKIRAWYADEVQRINQNYGIRPKPEE